MSQKSGKKLRKWVDNGVEEASSKLPPAEPKLLKENNIGNGFENEEKSSLPEKLEESEVNGTGNEKSQMLNEPAEQIVKEDVAKELIVELAEVSNQDEVEVDTIEYKETLEISKVVVNNEVSDENEEKVNENQDTKVEESESKTEVEDQSKSGTESELEPLILETVEVDPELEFDESSDVDSQKSSPVIRCATRRSQTRNIPTPKTPKTIDTNSDDKTSECSDKPSVVTVPTPEVTDTESEMSVFKPVTDVYDTNEKLFVKTNDEDIDSFHNVSTKAVAGNDTTRNVDFSLYPDDEFELSPFLIQSRERSVGETLKLLSARRSIRSTKEYGLQHINKKEYKTLPALPKRITKLSGMKRKISNDSTDYTKRFKSESPHLLSYISSPIANFKNRFTKSEIPSSTPKLTGYKSKNVFDNTNVSKITLNETEDVGEKKWCAIM